MKRWTLVALLAVPLAVSANDAFKDCSTKASKTAKKADLMAMAKVKEAEAKKIALGTAGKGASITKGGIETEDGCLVYSYHVKDPAKSGQNEVYVDAGNGKVLYNEHEGKLRTAMEKGVDKTKEAAVKAKDKIKEESKEVKDKVTK